MLSVKGKLNVQSAKTAINHVLSSMLPNQTMGDDGKSQNRQAKCVISLITALNVTKRQQADNQDRRGNGLTAA